MKAKKAKAKRPLPAPKPLWYQMKLYVTGATPRSRQAISNLRRLCDQYLPHGYELEVIDVYQKPELARKGQIIAAPTLVKMMPQPLRKFIGDMSNKQHLLAGLDISPTAIPPSSDRT